MKALTIKHPFIWAIIQGSKLFETRTWHPGKVTEFALHAGKGFDLPAQIALKRYVSDWPSRDQLTFGAVLGIATITDVYKVEEIRDDLDDLELAIGNWDSGYAWEIEVVEIFDKPILDVKGQLGLWNWTSPADKQAASDYLESLHNRGIIGGTLFTD